METKSLVEVQAWDLEDLDAFLAILEMKASSEAASHAFANRETK